jgi:hypothetical protein
MGFSSWLKYLPLTAAPIILMSGVAVGSGKPTATSASPNDPLSCYMTTSSGARIRLDKICGASNSMDNQKPVVRILPNGETEVTIIGNQSYTNPDGSVVSFNGTAAVTVWPNGVRSELHHQATKGSGFQFYYPDGRKLAPGDKVKMPDGSEVVQEHVN